MPAKKTKQNKNLVKPFTCDAVTLDLLEKQLTLFPDASPASLTLSTDTERLFSNILTLVRTDCGRMAGSSCSSSLAGRGFGVSTKDGEGASALGGGVGLLSEFTGMGSYC